MPWESLTTDTDLGDAPAKIVANLALLRSRFLAASWPETPEAGQACCRSDRGYAVYTYTGDTGQGESGWVEDAAASAAFQALLAEVAAARFDAASLAAYLAVEHNPDGGHKTALGRSDWIQETDAVARVGDQQFSVAGDHTSMAGVGRALEINDAHHGHVASASYESGTDLTTVTVMGCAVPEPLTKVEWGPDPRTDGVHVQAEASLTIASGVITPPAGAGLIQVDTEGGVASDDLETITLTHVPQGMALELRCASADRPVTLKHGAGNIGLAGGTDVVLNNPAKALRVVRVGSAVEERRPLHGHAVADVAGLQAALDAKADDEDLGTAALEDVASGGTGDLLRADGDGSGLTGIVSVPVGAVFWFAADTAPSGYLKANGASVSRTTYAALFAVIGTTFGVGDGSTTFGLPDLRGEFVRGWDDGRGVDSGRVFGSAQGDANKAHNHSVTGGAHTHEVYEDSLGGTGDALTLSTGHNTAATVQSDTGTHAYTVSSEGESEARPRNVALLACIKF